MNIVDIVTNYFNKLYEKCFIPKPPPPRWKLEPDHRGTYRLYQWDDEFSCYEYETGLIKDEEHAKKIIDILEKQPIYIREI